MTSMPARDDAKDLHNQDHWKQYYKMAAGRPPREFLQRTLRRFQAPGTAVDLGCGLGTDSLHLLDQGWEVHAIDRQEAAIESLLSTVPQDLLGRVEATVANFESAEIPLADLIWASVSLPFCHPAQFDALWERIRAALRPGGRFAGDFFGPRHAWAGNDSLTFFSKEEVLALCAGLELEYIIEEEGKQQTAADGIRQWHMFTICARK